MSEVGNVPVPKMKMSIDEYRAKFCEGKLLGRGNFGAVFETVDKKKRGYAVKRVMRDRKGLEMYELGILSELIGCPYITRVWWYVVEDPVDGMFLLVMDLCTCNLSEYAKNNQMSKLNTYRIFLGVARGLSFIHDKNIVHRDMKPANVLLLIKHGNIFVKICDFGGSVKKGEPLFDRVGTTFYLAPEIIKGKGYDEKVDIWSFAVTMHVVSVGGDKLFQVTALPSQPTLRYIQLVEKIISFRYPLDREGDLVKDPAHSDALEVLFPVMQLALNDNPLDRPSAPELAVLLSEMREKTQ